MLKSNLSDLSFADLQAMIIFCQKQETYWGKVETAKDPETEKDHQDEYNYWLNAIEDLDTEMFERVALIFKK